MTIRRKILLAVLTAALFGIALPAFAHPPQQVTLSWNPNGTLTVAVGHPVNDAQKHYVNKVIVYVNDQIAAQKEYQAQTSAEGFSDTFQLGAQPSGTVIKAEAFCIIMGSDAGSLPLP